MPGLDLSSGHGPAAEHPIDLTAAVFTPFGDTFDWAVPGLVISVPGLLLIVVAILVQTLGALAWLPVVRRRIGGFGLGAGRRFGRGSR